MGVLTRSSSRGANPQSAEPAKSKPNKLQKKNPLQIRAESTAEGNAPVIDTDDAQSLEKTAWVEPPQSRARPTWANPDSYFTPKQNTSLRTMRPIGQYPTVGDYKSVGLTPPTKGAIKRAIKRAFKFTVHATDEIGDAIITETPTPITPVVEEAVISDDLHVKANDGALSGSENVVAVKGPVETAVMEGLVREVRGDDVRDGSLATPISEAIGLLATKPSLSPLETPADTPADELLTEPALTVPDAHLTASQKAKSPLTTTLVDAVDVMDTMASETEKSFDRDLIAILDSLPVPQSSRYDVAQLKQVVASAISHSDEGGNDGVVLSLVYYWSSISGDDFKLSLIHNLGLKEPDHKLELALQTMLRHSVDDAKEWYKAYNSHRPALLVRHDSGSDSSLSSAQSLEIEPQGQTFKTSDIYRDTSGPRLEDLFNSGKSNTAPLKRPKKPCPVNEKSYKRRREWESDPSLDQNIQQKRARLVKETEPDEEVMAKTSAVRPKRGRRAAAEQSPVEGPTIETTDVEEIAQSVEGPSELPPGGPQRGGRGRGRGRSRGGRARPARSTRGQQAELAEPGEPAGPETAPTAAPAQALGKRRREWSLDTTVSAESELSNECYSERENDWHNEFGRRQMPNSIEPPDNSDNCYECDQVGNLLCCDTCENAFHFECLRPPVDPQNPPKGEWYCPRCGVRNSLTTAIAHGRHKKRKTEYSPPTEIKEYFIGVGEAHITLSHDPKDVKNHRAYKRVPHIPRLTKPPKKGTEKPAYNDPNLLKMSENGHVILCDGCGRCTDNMRPIIRCDFCPSRFHLDCLDPPLADVPRPHGGWMCPRHVRPDEGIVTKMVDGRLQERRVRRSKHTIASIDVEPIPYDDVNESTFDDDFREERHLLPAGDFVLDFISAVRKDRSRQEKDFFSGLAETCINLTRSLVEQHLAQNSSASAEVTATIAPQINEAIENLQTGKSTKDQYDAALSLVGLSKGESNSADSDA